MLIALLLANPALQNTHSTRVNARVNDAGMQSRFMAKLPSAFSYLIIHLLLTIFNFFLIILTAELLDPWLDLLSV